MPKVPVYDQGQVQPQVGPSVRRSVDAPVEAFGGGVSRVTDAVGGVLDLGGKLALQEKAKQDDIRTQDAYAKVVEVKNRLAWDPKEGALTRRGADAAGVSDEFVPKFNKEMDAISESLSNPEQKAMFSKIRSDQSGEFSTMLLKHSFVESQKFQEETAAKSIEQTQQDAILNYQDPVEVGKKIDLQASIITDHARSLGWTDEMRDHFIRQAASKTHLGVMQRMLDNGRTQQAQEYLDHIKGQEVSQLTGSDAATIEKALKNNQILDEGVKTWNRLKGLRLADGSPDEAKAESIIMARTDVATEQKLKLVEFYKARASEDVANQARQDKAADRSFMNSVLTAKKEGVPLDVSLKQVPKYAKDNYDESLKADVVRKAYAPPTASNPSAYMSIWEKVQDKKASKTEIDLAFQREQINVNDWRKLREEYHNQNSEAKDPEFKNTWERVKILAESNFGSNKQKKDEFLYEMHSSTEGKSAQEIWQLANDKLKKVSGSWWAGDPGAGLFSNDPQYKVDMQKRDATNLGWGKVYQDIGKSEAAAIGKAVLSTGKKSLELSDIESFAKGFGGYDKIKPGTPVHNAIQSLMRHGQLVTPANINFRLKQYPDGNF